LPSIAFFTAVSMGAIGVLRRTRPRPLLGPAALLVVVGGLVVGVAGGMRRSREVADSLHANCASKVLRDGLFLFDREAPLYRHHKRRQASIPPERRRAGLERLASLGIRSPMDLSELERDMLHRRKYLRNQETRSALFLPRYDYKSF
jgi:hypothetical protein